MTGCQSIKVGGRKSNACWHNTMVWWTRRHTGADAILITRQRDSSRKEQENEKEVVEVEEEEEKRRTLPSHLPFCWAKSWLLQWHTQRKKRQHVRGGENATKFLQNFSAEKLLTALPTFWRNDWLFFNPSEAAAADVRCHTEGSHQIRLFFKLFKQLFIKSKWKKRS